VSAKASIRQIFHESNTVGYRKVYDLTADPVIVVFHPPGFFVLGLADCIELLGLPSFRRLAA
jgi:hypothetical protein